MPKMTQSIRFGIVPQLDGINKVLAVFKPLYNTGLELIKIKGFEKETEEVFNQSQQNGDDLETSISLAADKAGECLNSINNSLH